MKKVLLFLTVIFVSLGFKCGGKSKSAEDILREKLPITIPSPLPVQNIYETPKTALVGGNFGLSNELRQEYVVLVDDGISRTLRVTEPLGYTQFRTHYEHTVIYALPTSYSAEGNCPTLNLKTGQKIAGTVISLGDVLFEPPFIFVAFDSNALTSKFCRDFAQYSVAYEAEHIQAWFNDRNKFWSTTGANDVHPIYEEPGLKEPFRFPSDVVCAHQLIGGGAGLKLEEFDEKSQKSLREAWQKHRDAMRKKAVK